MAARTPIPFYTAFEAAVRPTGMLTQMASDATLKTLLLHYFNRSYKIGLDLPTLSGQQWEDNRTASLITPTSGLITYDQIGEAREFKVWDEDPRYTKLAERVVDYTDPTGIRVSETDDTPVWVSWVPLTLKFSYTPWAAADHDFAVGDVRMYSATGNCYRCSTAHSTTSGSDFLTDLAAAKWVLMPVLAVLEEFLIGHMQATWIKESGGQPDTGYKLQTAAIDDLREIHRAELRRHLASKT